MYERGSKLFLWFLCTNSPATRGGILRLYVYERFGTYFKIDLKGLCSTLSRALSLLQYGVKLIFDFSVHLAPSTPSTLRHSLPHSFRALSPTMLRRAVLSQSPVLKLNQTTRGLQGVVPREHISGRAKRGVFAGRDVRFGNNVPFSLKRWVLVLLFIFSFNVHIGGLLKIFLTLGLNFQTIHVKPIIIIYIYII